VPRPLTISSLEPVVKALRTTVFNDALWPDFSQLPTPDKPIVKYRGMVDEVEYPVGNLWVTPVAVNHTVACSGFIVHDGTSGIVYSGDTGPTEALWKAAAASRGCRP